MGEVNVEKELQELLTELSKERSELLHQIEENNMQIKGVQCLIDSLTGTGDADEKVFSPRDTRRIHKKEIADAEQEIEEIKKENTILEEKTARIDSHILGLKTVLEEMMRKTLEEEQEKEKEKEAKTAKEAEAASKQEEKADNQKTAVETLTRLLHKIDLGVLFMEQDVMRAKLELTGVKKELQEVMKYLQEEK